MKFFNKMLLNTEMKQICFVSTYRQNILKNFFSDGIFSDNETDKNFHKFQFILVISEKENILKQSHLLVFNIVSDLKRGLKYKTRTRPCSDQQGSDNIKIKIKVYKLMSL